MITLYACTFDVQIIENICHCIITVAVISAIARCIMKLMEYIHDYKKTYPKKNNEDNGNTNNSSVDSLKQEMQKRDRAKALVRDFYDATSNSDKEKDIESTKALLELYNTVLDKEKTE